MQYGTDAFSRVLRQTSASGRPLSSLNVRQIHQLHPATASGALGHIREACLLLNL